MCLDEIFETTGQEANWVTDILKRSSYPQDRRQGEPKKQ
jgi:hypothetical protein